MADNQSKAYVENLNDMMVYQSGSIVSKIITNKQAGAVTMFAFDQGQGVSEQSLPYDSVLFIIDGEMEITIGFDDPVLVKKGGMVYISANISHVIMGLLPFKMFSIMIRSS